MKAPNSSPAVTGAGWLLPAAAVLLAVVLSNWGTLHGLVREWLANEDFSHGLLIVPVCLVVGWQKRAELRRAAFRTDWRAVPLLAAAVGISIVGELGAELFTVRLSLLLLVIGSIWLLFGAEVVRILRFPLALLFLMLPLPGFVYRNLTFSLQLLASALSVLSLQALGLSAYREGNVIDLGFTTLQVVEACNGLRFILPLLTMGVLFAYFGQRSLWKKLALVAATVPIAILANVIRIAGTGLLAMKWGPGAAEGFFHSFSGWLVFMVCCALFALFSAVLRFLPGRAPERPQPEATSPQEAGRRSVSLAAAGVAAAVALITPVAVNYLGHVPAVRLARPLGEFTLVLDGRQGQKETMDPKLWERVGGQDYILINYWKPGESPINFYVAYYEHQRKGGDFIHTPRLCLPGAGWFIESNHTRVLPGDGEGRGGLSPLRLNELVVSKDGKAQLTYFWYQGRGRNFTNEFQAKFYMVWDGLWRRRTDGALVRLMMPLGSRATEGEARDALDRFARAVSQELQRYLP